MRTHATGHAGLTRHEAKKLATLRHFLRDVNDAIRALESVAERSPDAHRYMRRLVRRGRITHRVK